MIQNFVLWTSVKTLLLRYFFQITVIKKDTILVSRALDPPFIHFLRENINQSYLQNYNRKGLNDKLIQLYTVLSVYCIIVDVIRLFDFECVSKVLQSDLNLSTVSKESRILLLAEGVQPPIDETRSRCISIKLKTLLLFARLVILHLRDGSYLTTLNRKSANGKRC